MFQAHTGTIYSLAIGTDNQFVSGMQDGEIGIWDLGSGKQIKKLSGQNGAIYSVISIDKRIIFGTQAGEIGIWNADNSVKMLQSQEGAVYSLAISSDNKNLISGAAQGEINIWDLNTHQLVRTLISNKLHLLSGDSNSVIALAIKEKKRFISVAQDGVARIWNLHTGKELKKLSLFAPINAAASNKNATQIATVVRGPLSSKVVTWNLNTGKQTMDLSNKLYAYSVAMSSDGQTIIVGATDGKICIFNTNPTFEQTLKYIAEQNSIKSDEFDFDKELEEAVEFLEKSEKGKELTE